MAPRYFSTPPAMLFSVAEVDRLSARYLFRSILAACSYGSSVVVPSRGGGLRSSASSASKRLE